MTTSLGKIVRTETRLFKSICCAHCFPSIGCLPHAEAWISNLGRIVEQKTLEVEAARAGVEDANDELRREWAKNYGKDGVLAPPPVDDELDDGVLSP